MHLIYIKLDMVKRNSEGEIVKNSTGPEYYDDSSPWEGVYIEYIQDIAEVNACEHFQAFACDPNIMLCSSKPNYKNGKSHTVITRGYREPQLYA